MFTNLMLLILKKETDIVITWYNFGKKKKNDTAWYCSEVAHFSRNVVALAEKANADSYWICSNWYSSNQLPDNDNKFLKVDR